MTKSSGWLVAILSLVLGVATATSPLWLDYWQLHEVSAPLRVEATDGRISEAVFESAVDTQITSDPARATAWRAARADHRLLVHAILACDNRLEEMASMVPAEFGALLLDLAPDGSHVLPHFPPPTTQVAANHTVASDADKPIQASRPSGGTPTLDPAEQAILSLSDSIARARLLAAAEIYSALPSAQYFWIATVVVSGLATFFVTVQAKMQPPKDDASTWQRGRYHGIAYLAVGLSIFGTTLTALKQFNDPTRAVVQNEHTLRDLRKLHQQIVLAVSCQPGGDGKSNPVIAYENEAGNAMAGWRTAMADLQAEIVPPYAAPSSSFGSSERDAK